MLSEIEFLSWCEKNKISKSTHDYINNNIRHTQPVRSVGNGKSTQGKYPSKKWVCIFNGKVEVLRGRLY